MNRIAYMVLRNIIRVPGWFYRIGKLGREDDSHTDQERYDYLRKLIEKVNRTGRVTIEKTGLKNIPEENGFILFPNHQGLGSTRGVPRSTPQRSPEWCQG